MKTHENLDKNWISKGSLDWFPVKIFKKNNPLINGMFLDVENLWNFDVV